MCASFLSLPYELLEEILISLLQQKALDDTLTDDSLLVERIRHQILESVEIDIIWADHAPFGSRALQSSVRG